VAGCEQVTLVVGERRQGVDDLLDVGVLAVVRRPVATAARLGLRAA
jgi:hypothetical protein